MYLLACSQISQFFFLSAHATDLFSEHFIRSKRATQCQNNYVQCSPEGISSLDVPPVGPSLAPLYEDVLISVNASTPKGRAARNLTLEKKGPEDIFCCEPATECRALRGFWIPFCWDKFTTNFYLPDGSYGSTETGKFVCNGGTLTVDLLSGEISGFGPISNPLITNIYDSIPSDRPNLTSLVRPTPYTSIGVGSAIPVSQLGYASTATTTFPQTTCSASTAYMNASLSTNPTGSTLFSATLWCSTFVSKTALATNTNLITSTVSPTDSGGRADSKKSAATQENWHLSLMTLVVVLTAFLMGFRLA